MNLQRRLAPVLIGVVAVITAGVLPAAALQASNGIDDPGGNDDAPGVNVIREVGTSGSVVVRLNKGDRQAHFRVMVRGVDVLAIDDVFPRGNGLEDKEPGVYGGCRDELITEFGPRARKRKVAKAKFYTCTQHDSIRLYLGDRGAVTGAIPSIKIAFADGVLGNTEGVFVGTSTTDVAGTWIPLFEE